MRTRMTPMLVAVLFAPSQEEAQQEFDPNEDVHPTITTIGTPDSDCFERIGYEEISESLYLTFRSGQTYRYLNVPMLFLMEMLMAPSKGEYFWQAIRMRFIAERVS
jgi:hypothetical protein